MPSLKPKPTARDARDRAWERARLQAETRASRAMKPIKTNVNLANCVPLAESISASHRKMQSGKTGEVGKMGEVGEMGWHVVEKPGARQVSLAQLCSSNYLKHSHFNN